MLISEHGHGHPGRIATGSGGDLATASPEYYSNLLQICGHH